MYGRKGGPVHRPAVIFQLVVLSNLFHLRAAFTAQRPRHHLRLDFTTHRPRLTSGSLSRSSCRTSSRRFDGIRTFRASGNTDDTAPGALSETSAASTSTKYGRMDLLESRLRNLGAVNYDFVKEVDASAAEAETPNGVMHVKTLIWEAVLVVPCSSGSGRIIEEKVDHYFITALRVEDRVDLQRLYDIVKAHTLQLSPADMELGRLMLRLAKREVAEELSGYQSGTIPPIAHSQPGIPLFVDQVVAKAGSDTMIASVGAGSPGYDLHLPVEEMLRVAQLSSEIHIKNLSISKKKSSKQSFQQQSPMSGDDKTNIEQETGPSQIETQMLNTKGKTERAKLLRSAAKKKGNSEVLRRMLDNIGDEFPSLMEVEDYGFGGIDKSAVHHAAWKGDLESLTILIERGKDYGMDLVNQISQGEGNYGKTPIFYALTQCREDAVLLLIARGANLLIVNNKGQTPCSIAVSHLKPEICQLLYDVEASQIQSGGTFKNYRTSHSDGKKYGDLDPRFTIDEDNMDDDIVAEIGEYNKILCNATGNQYDDSSSKDDQYKLLQSTTVPNLPRSIRETTRHWNKPKAPTDENQNSDENKQSVRVPKQENRNDKNQQRILQERIEPKSLEQDIDYGAFEELSLESDVFGADLQVRIVDDEGSVLEFAKIIDETLAEAMSVATNAHELVRADDDIINNSWGLDAEWKPSFLATGEETPVATLQLHSTRTGYSFIIDVQSLLQPAISDSNHPMTETERQLSDALLKIFPNKNISLLGFGVAVDLGKLAASFPHIPCFRRFENVIDLHTVSRNVYAGTPKTYLSSLQKMVAVLLSKSLDKTEQCSDWEIRPLTPSQIQYACLDAAVLPTLLRSMLSSDSDSVQQYEGSFIHGHPHLRSTTKLICLGACDALEDSPQYMYACAPQLAYSVPYGSAKVHLQHVMARQIWQTGKDDPPMPQLLSTAEQISIAESRIPKDKRKKSKRDIDDTAAKDKKKKMKKKTVKLKSVPADFERLPQTGEILGYTKDECINALLGEDFLSSLSEQNFRLGFNRRGGVLGFSNAFCLFINFGLSDTGELPAHWSQMYRNDFLDDGRRLTFTVNCERDQERALMEFFAFHKKSTNAMKVLLFVRSSARAKFMYCGQCACNDQARSESYTNLVLELMDYENLITPGPDGDSSAFEELVALQSAAFKGTTFAQK